MDIRKTIKICLIGDIFPGELIYTQRYGLRSQFLRHRGKPWLENIKKIIGENDVVIGNLESPLVKDDDTLKKTFYGDPAFAHFLRECNINVLNIANNHILEHGSSGFESTIKVLNDAGLSIIGQLEDTRSKILYLNLNDFKIGIAGFSNVDLHKIKNDANWAVLNSENVLAAIESMRTNSTDIKILSFHWGNEYIHYPSMEQRRMAYKFIDAGVDIIAGHHSHCIQPIEKYKDGLIFYSLGNFLFDYIQSKKMSIGLCVQLSINKNMQKHFKLQGVKLSTRGKLDRMDDIAFENYLNTISKHYEQMIILNDNVYAAQYKKSLRRIHTLERIKMKTSIISEFCRIDHKSRVVFLDNLINYYCK